jgi:hypothetical protein
MHEAGILNRERKHNMRIIITALIRSEIIHMIIYWNQVGGGERTYNVWTQTDRKQQHI